MLCPVCQFDNLEGEDSCDYCGADLRTVDIPQPAASFEGRLLGEQLDALGIRPPTEVAPELPAAEAIRQMREAPTDCLLVIDGGRLVGIFTERDAVLKLAGRPLAGITTGQVMTADPVVLRHDDTIAAAINKMAVGGFRHIPIVEDGVPLGVIAAPDVFRHLHAILE